MKNKFCVRDAKFSDVILFVGKKLILTEERYLRLFRPISVGLNLEPRWLDKNIQCWSITYHRRIRWFKLQFRRRVSLVESTSDAVFFAINSRTSFLRFFPRSLLFSRGNLIATRGARARARVDDVAQCCNFASN